MPARIVTLVGVLGVVLAARPARADEPATRPCAGWIAIESKPVAGGAIMLDGKSTGLTTPATLKDVACGAHVIQVSKRLYAAAAADVNVTAAEVVRVKLSLKPNFGNLGVTSDPVGARLVIDGVAIGVAPLVIDQIEAGLHELEATLPDHRTVKRAFTIGADEHATLSVKLAPVFGVVQVTASPEADADVLLDGKLAGKAPLTLPRVPSGPHVVQVAHEHFRPFERQVIVSDGETVQVKAVLEANYGTLTVTASLPACLVKVDGAELGRTPLTVRVAPGPRTIAVEPPDGPYGRVEEKVTVALLGESRVNARFVVLTGSLLVDTSPFGATIELDGKPIGTAPLALASVPIGRHTITARLSGQPPVTGRLRVLEGETAVAEVNLSDPRRSSYRSTSPTGRPGTKAAAPPAPPASQPAPAPEQPPGPPAPPH